MSHVLVAIVAVSIGFSSGFACCAYLVEMRRRRNGQ